MNVLLFLNCCWILQVFGQPLSSSPAISEKEDPVENEDLLLAANHFKQRMARFFMDSASASSVSPGSLLDLGLDSNAILTGVLQPENIAIHVAQNAVNFVASSLAWLALGLFSSQTSLSGRGIDPDILSASSSSSSSDSGHLQPILISGHHQQRGDTSSHTISVPFMSRNKFTPVSSKIKELPSLTYKQQQQKQTFGDLSPAEKQKFIMKHLTNRNFVASVPFPSKKLKVNDEDINRRIDVTAAGKKLVKKVVKKVVHEKNDQDL